MTIRPNQPATSWRHTLRYKDVCQELPVRDTVLVQLSAGQNDQRSLYAVGDSMVISRVQTLADTAGYLVPAIGWSLLLMPMGWRGTYCLNGAHAARHNAYLVSDRTGYSGHGKSRDIFGVMIRTTELAAAVRSLGGYAEAAQEFIDNIWQLTPEQGAALRAPFLQVLITLQEHHGHDGLAPLPPMIEAQLTDHFAQHVIALSPQTKPADDHRLADIQITRRVLEGGAQSGGAASMSELCKHAGVGATRLHKAFAQTQGVSPMSFIRLARLTRAREWLLDPDDPPRSVKDAALACGFMHLGRFSQAYKRQYGESPSDTLRTTATGLT